MWRTRKCALGRSEFVRCRAASIVGWNWASDMVAVREGCVEWWGRLARRAVGRSLVVREDKL